jgi:hypothetical protein
MDSNFKKILQSNYLRASNRPEDILADAGPVRAIHIPCLKTIDKILHEIAADGCLHELLAGLHGLQINRHTNISLFRIESESSFVPLKRIARDELLLRGLLN